MKKFRSSIFIKPISIILTFLTLNLTFNSCSKDSNSNDIIIPEKVFDGKVIEMETGENGQHKLNTEISSSGENFDLTFDFKIVDQNGDPVEGIKIGYNQINEKCLIYIYDEQGRYASKLFIGTPRELEALFSGKSQSENSNLPNENPNETNYKDSESLIVLGIVALITVISIGVAEVGFILNAYKVQEFYLTDYVEETEDYIMYCKNFEEISELIKSRTNMVLHLSSIFISFVSLGGSGSSLAIELTNSIGMEAASKIREELLNQAIEAWGVTMNDIVGRKVAVKVYPYEEDQSFSGARNLFATYTIEFDNEACYGNGIITGTVSDAETGNGLEGAIVRLSGDDQSTDITNNQGEYSFESLDEGEYTVSVEKSNYITEEKDIQFDGSSAVVNFVLSQSIGNDEYRVVLTWGETPEDMDIHLYTENNDHIYYNNQGDLYNYPFIYLDIDDLHSYGPETITIKELQSSRIYVHNYSGYPDIKESDSEIRVYNGSSLIRQYEIPSSGSGDWWYVFDIDSNGHITDKDYLTDSKFKNENKNH